ncbi:MAG: hypothetical protein K0R03_1361 [Moraxellaceae bacterium]|jgi:hypothetical protein|nr:hypothetical protein [Moraxellaceae bacterium]
MNLRLPSLLLATGLGLSMSLAMAEGPAPAPAPGAEQAAPAGKAGRPGPARKMMREQKRESFTEESIRKMADGRVIKRQIEQKVGENSLYRKEITTNPEGKTATITVTSTFDKDKKVWTRKIEGVNFDGSTWSRTNQSAAPHDQHDDEPDVRPEPPRKGKKG